MLCAVNKHLSFLKFRKTIQWVLLVLETMGLSLQPKRLNVYLCSLFKLLTALLKW